MKYFLLFLLVITLLTVDIPVINKVRSELFNLIGNVAESEFSQSKTSRLIADNLSVHFKQFSDKEEAYVAKITESAESLMVFHRQYCRKPNFNEKLSKANTTLVCKQIHAHIDVLEAELVRRKPVN